MKILISDYAESMMPYHEEEIRILKEGLGTDVEVEVFAYTDSERERFAQKLEDADALLTAFVTIDRGLMERAKRLKAISLNSTGYNFVDLEEATRRGIAVCPVGEYCTEDVSEGTVALLFALNKGHKHYTYEIEGHRRWDYASFPALPRIEEQTLGIFGFGRIGKCTARKMKHLCRRIIACDPYVDPELAHALGVELLSKEQVLAESDIIVNHMPLTEETTNYFDESAFLSMQRRPIFLNMARGGSVDHHALAKCLDEGQVRAAGLDVLEEEMPVLAGHPLVGRKNVLITPHSSFYSSTSLQNLMRISSENIVNCLRGEYEKVNKLVNAPLNK